HLMFVIPHPPVLLVFSSLLYYYSLSSPSSTRLPYTTLFRSRVDVLIAQRLRRILRHRTANVVEQRRGIRPVAADGADRFWAGQRDRKSTRLNSSHVSISYAVFCLKKKMNVSHFQYLDMSRVM